MEQPAAADLPADKPAEDWPREFSRSISRRSREIRIVQFRRDACTRRGAEARRLLHPGPEHCNCLRLVRAKTRRENSGRLRGAWWQDLLSRRTDAKRRPDRGL